MRKREFLIISVPPGKQAEIVLPIRSPRPGFIDILLANAEVHVEVVLPDGRVVKEGEPKDGEPSLIGMSDEMLGAATKVIKSQLIGGPGLHIFFSLSSRRRRPVITASAWTVVRRSPCPL